MLAYGLSWAASVARGGVPSAAAGTGAGLAKTAVEGASVAAAQTVACAASTMAPPSPVGRTRGGESDCGCSGTAALRGALMEGGLVTCIDDRRMRVAWAAAGCGFRKKPPLLTLLCEHARKRGRQDGENTHGRDKEIVTVAAHRFTANTEVRARGGSCVAGCRVGH